MKYEMPKIEISYFDSIYSEDGTTTGSIVVTNAAITGNQYIEKGTNAVAARTARVQTIIKLNRPQ